MRLTLGVVEQQPSLRVAWMTVVFCLCPAMDTEGAHSCLAPSWSQSGLARRMFCDTAHVPQEATRAQL